MRLRILGSDGGDRLIRQNDFVTCERVANPPRGIQGRRGGALIPRPGVWVSEMQRRYLLLASWEVHRDFPFKKPRV